jgi:HEAT repeat protein
MRLFLILLCVCTCSARSQEDPGEIRRLREGKFEAILRVQDSRTPHDGKLVSLLADGDPLVRRRAFLAYGSIQDSTALPLLLQGLADPFPEVASTAAFAVGQTATLLSPSHRADLEQDILWNRLRTTTAPDQIIEELGKFGTRNGLQDLITRIGNVYPHEHVDAVTMAVARFGIRGITDPSAIHYLIAALKNAEATPWRAMYALQRIGDHPETQAELEHLALFRQHEDPLVRMHLALLLGKVRDERICKDPLTRMAQSDADWRVRVTALRSLASYPLATDPNALDIYRRACLDGNAHIALAAITALRNSDLVPPDTNRSAREVFERLYQLAANPGNGYAWELQGEAANTIAVLLRDAAFRRIPSASWPNPIAFADMLGAQASTGAAAAGPREGTRVRAAAHAQEGRAALGAGPRGQGRSRRWRH